MTSRFALAKYKMAVTKPSIDAKRLDEGTIIVTTNGTEWIVQCKNDKKRWIKVKTSGKPKRGKKKTLKKPAKKGTSKAQKRKARKPRKSSTTMSNKELDLIRGSLSDLLQGEYFVIAGTCEDSIIEFITRHGAIVINDLSNHPTLLLNPGSGPKSAYKSADCVKISNALKMGLDMIDLGKLLDTLLLLDQEDEWDY